MFRQTKTSCRTWPGGYGVWRPLGLGLVIACLTASTLVAQNSSYAVQDTPLSPKEKSGPGKSVAIKDRTISLSFGDVTVGDALRLIARAADAKLTYISEVKGDQGKKPLVSLSGKSITVAAALEHVLENTGLKFEIVPPNEIVITPTAALKRQDSVRGKSQIRGQISDSSSRQPIGSATVGVMGGEVSRNVMSGDNGEFIVDELPAGQYLLSIRRIGYRTVQLRVVLGESQDTSITILMDNAARMLTSVVTTGSGDRAKLEVGNSIATINAADVVESESIRNISELLANRAPGLQVTGATGALGSPSRLRIRGISSITQSNDPIIILDGVRISGAYSDCPTIFTNGCLERTSRLDDIDPESIESIEVLKGPAASTLFGSEAAAGVLVIKTKRGRIGENRWTVRGDQEYLNPNKAFEVPAVQMGISPNLPGQFSCNIVSQANGNCLATDSIVRWESATDPLYTPLATGRNSAVNLSVSGGAQNIQYHLSGSYTDQLGISKLPRLNEKMWSNERGGETPPKWMRRPNAQKRTNANARLTGNLNRQVDYSLGVNLIRLYQRTGPNGTQGLMNEVRTSADTVRPVDGWTTVHVESPQNVTRSLSNMTVDWRPMDGWTVNTTFGWDYSNRADNRWERRTMCLPFCTETSGEYKGSMSAGRTEIDIKSFNIGSNYIYQISQQIRLRTAIGGQYVQNGYNSFFARVQDVQLGRVGMSAGSTGAVSNYLTSETSDRRITAGWYLDESLVFSEKLFLGAAIRQDAGSSLGSSIRPTYPKWNISYLLSQEQFFPWGHFMTVRLRTAFGKAGVLPGSLSKFPSFADGTQFVEVDGSQGAGMWIGGVGNPALRPERGVEREGGFEVGVWNDRLTVDFTYFNKTADDALLSAPVPPSVGTSSNQWINIGKVRNTGTEVTVGLRPVDNPTVSWNMNLGYSSRRNLLVRMAPGVAPFSVVSGGSAMSNPGDFGRIAAGYPLFGRWARPILGYNDENDDGIIVRSEVRVGDSAVYMGPSQAKFDLGIHQNVSFWDGRIRASGSFQYVNGLVQLNHYRYQWRNYLACSQFVGACSLADQAAVVAANAFGGSAATYAGFYEKTDLLRFSSFSLAYTLPPHLSRAFKARLASVSFIASNIGIWTNFHGKDPDVNSAAASGNEYFFGHSLPRPRSLGMRLNLQF